MENNVEDIIKNELCNMTSKRFVDADINKNEIASVIEIGKLIIEDKNIEQLQGFDVRNKVMKIVRDDCEKLVTEKPEDSKTYDRNEYSGAYEKMKDSQNVVAKTALGKKWTTAFNYDYDASLVANYIYCKAFFAEKTNKKIKKDKGYEHKISFRCFFRGDTMNSWSRTLNKFFDLYGDRYLNNSNNLGDTEEQKWVEFLSNSDNYKKNETLPLYITEFMKAVYTMGNFIPVPIGFNTEHNSRIKDYWDLTLLEIYNYYMSEKKCSSWLEKYKAWFDDYGTGIGQKGWDSFVEKNYMQPFVNKIKNKNDGKYGLPYELWEGHFRGDVMPKEEVQFQQFFVNAKVRILERGKLIADALIKEFKKSETQK